MRETGGMLGVSFGVPDQWPDQDLIGYSAEFDAALAYEAYRCGVFPMPLEPGSPEIGWWSPVRRGLLPIDGLRVTRSLRQSVKRYTSTTDAAFEEVVLRCADPAREHGWIDARVCEAYAEMHRCGLAHSVEVWDDAGSLVGGLYGVRRGALFAGESMFHDRDKGRDASKTALVRLVVELGRAGGELLDVQWLTGHLASLGAYEVSRRHYLFLLGQALGRPMRPWSREAVSGPQLLRLWDTHRAS